MAKKHTAAVSEAAPAEEKVTLDDALGEIRAAMEKHYAGESLFTACREGNLMQAKVAISNGADGSAVDADGNTPMHFAAQTGAQDIVSFLLAQNFAFDVSNRAGFTPLAFAVTAGHAEVADDLTGAGANVNHALPGLKETLLMMAAYRNYPAVVASLLKHGAAVDAQDVNGATASMRAAGQNNTLCLQILMDGGADPYVKSNTGRTAFDFAQRSRAANTISYLDAFMPEYTARTAHAGQAKEVTPMKKISFRKPDFLPLG